MQQLILLEIEHLIFFHLDTHFMRDCGSILHEDLTEKPSKTVKY